MILRDTIPDTIEVRNEANDSYSLRASRDIKQGEKLYESTSYLCNGLQDNDDVVLLLSANNIQSLYHLTPYYHGYKTIYENTEEELYELYTFESFINHSCDPNVKYALKSMTHLNRVYEVIAVKDIVQGEELLSNYLHFIYDDAKGRFECECGSMDCYGTIQGFKYLNQEQQTKILQQSDYLLVQIYGDLLNKLL